MTAVIIIIGSIAAIVGITVATWSIIDTRKQYGESYQTKKRGVDD